MPQFDQVLLNRVEHIDTQVHAWAVGLLRDQRALHAAVFVPEETSSPRTHASGVAQTRRGSPWPRYKNHAEDINGILDRHPILEFFHDRVSHRGRLITLAADRPSVLDAETS